LTAEALRDRPAQTPDGRRTPAGLKGSMGRKDDFADAVGAEKSDQTIQKAHGGSILGVTWALWEKQR
jgi:hypothetical protein